MLILSVLHSFTTVPTVVVCFAGARRPQNKPVKLNRARLLETIASADPEGPSTHFIVQTPLGFSRMSPNIIFGCSLDA